MLFRSLTETMAELVTLLAPMAAAEREVEHVERLFGFRRRRKPAAPTTDVDAGGAPGI